MLKNIFLTAAVFFISCLSITQAKYYVYDEANIIPVNHEQVLEKIIWEWTQHTKHQMAIVTVKSLGNKSIEQVAIEKFKDKHIGRKGIDDGILFLIAPNEQRVRFEIGYGLEEYLPDGLVGSILDSYVLPYFKSGDMVKGILYGTTAIITTQAEREGIVLPNVSNGQLPQTTQPSKRIPGDLISGLILFIAFMIFIKSGTYKRSGLLPWLILGALSSSSGSYHSISGFNSFGGGFGSFGGGMSGGGGASRGW